MRPIVALAAFVIGACSQQVSSNTGEQLVPPVPQQEYRFVPERWRLSADGARLHASVFDLLPLPNDGGISGVSLQIERSSPPHMLLGSAADQWRANVHSGMLRSTTAPWNDAVSREFSAYGGGSVEYYASEDFSALCRNLVPLTPAGQDLNDVPDIMCQIAPVENQRITLLFPARLARHTPAIVRLAKSTSERILLMPGSAHE